nr:hypothetical protein CJLB15_00095 [Campylobacter phage CJLB-15]
MKRDGLPPMRINKAFSSQPCQYDLIWISCLSL